ncbi:MAG: hypothetical protein ACI9YT_002100 [Halobacteriales archaeon]|jgi:hypothetical protein
MEPRHFLRIEGLAVLAGALGVYFGLGGPLWLLAVLALLVVAVWVGHIGADRLFGYGLKFESGFKETHLSVQPAPLPGFVDSE